MKKYFKRVIIATLCICLIVLGGLYLYVRITLGQFHEPGTVPADLTEQILPPAPDNPDIVEPPVEEDPYLKMLDDSNRVNVLCLGVAKYALADTIMLLSFDPDSKLVDLISIPRDTYYYRPGSEKSTEKKINSSFSYQNIQQIMNAVRDITQMPIHHYVRVDYKGVERIVDTIGGVAVKVPFDMNYDDPVDDLHIHFTKGTQTLDGADAIRYLRYRHDNDNSHISEGDLGRVKRQQAFILSALKKSLGLKLVTVVNKSKKYVKTSMTADEMLGYITHFTNLSMDNVKTYTLPGKGERRVGLDFFVHDPEKVLQMVTSIYTRQPT